MGINIVVFTPEGLVLSTDCQSEIKNKDDGYYLGTVRRSFVVFDRFVVSFIGNGFIEGYPYCYFINKFIVSDLSFKGNVSELATRISDSIKEISNQNFSFYAAGYDFHGKTYIPKVYIADSKGIYLVNADNDGKPVYNYHMSGDSTWANKVLLETHFVDKEHNEQIDFEPVAIDFSKYSIIDGIFFAKGIISITQTLNILEQRKPVINRNIITAIIDPVKGASFLEQQV